MYHPVVSEYHEHVSIPVPNTSSTSIVGVDETGVYALVVGSAYAGVAITHQHLQNVAGHN